MSDAPLMPIAKYQPFAPIALKDRTWPNAQITQAPIWCSVDLRDGNQALVEPMGTERKSRMFALLLALGFREIEVAFPSASQTDFDFVRSLIESNKIPEGVAIQVLTQCRADLIDRTFEAIEGAQNVIFHFYNSTSTLQREVVFRQDRKGITNIAVEAAKRIRERAETVMAKSASKIQYEYSPESFTGTELDYALEICEAVKAVLEPTADHKLILNLPATVEMATPNVYADQIEWFLRQVSGRETITLSVHPHNDRGTAVAATELALMAGADRVEGTLLGNGERTGNVDLVTLGLNLFTQGVDPKLDLSNVDQILEVVEYCNQITTHPRHPYVGEFVYTAFSGSHQDAIKKGFDALQKRNDGVFAVPYLPIDPKDVGRSYEAVIRINSQSGKGGIAYLLKTDHGLDLPRSLQVEFSKIAQTVMDQDGQELSSEALWQLFSKTYGLQEASLTLLSHEMTPVSAHVTKLTATLSAPKGETLVVEGTGNGPVDAFVDALARHYALDFALTDYKEHALGRGASAQAASYIVIELADGATFHGVGLDENIILSSLKAVLSAVLRAKKIL